MRRLIGLALLALPMSYVSPALGADAAQAAPPSIFAQEAAMNAHDLVARWNPLIAEASRRFAVPEPWIRAVMTVESGGRTMLGEMLPMTSSAGAMGLMQIMPETWRTMQLQYGLGTNPYDPHDNILAGTAVLSLLYRHYGYPALFAAYNDGPAALDGHVRLGEDVPPETTDYVLDIASILRTGARRRPGAAGDLDWLLKPEPAPDQAGLAPIAARPAAPRREYPADDDDDYDGN
ncbi:MAG TPA: lytic transglycosylase domain-containing protein [Rhizomicrobium sp.]|nr:lytic transglycosylase domain-containing protein [Rhizomicrobium sp.]